jgi:hypothetical protein
MPRLIRFHSIPIYLLFLAIFTPAGAIPPPVRGLAADGPISIDGRLTEPSWQQGEWYSGFSLLDLPDQPASMQTRFKVRFDASHLYIGVQADEPHTAAMRTEVTEKDGKVFRDDCVEVMIDPTGERIEYYHFIVNAMGTLYDAQRRQGGHVFTAEWNSSATAAAHIGTDSWSVELRIPVIELGLTTASTTDWAIDVARERQPPPAELSTFAPLTGGFHQSTLYSALQLDGADFDRFLWELDHPGGVRAFPEGDNLTFSARTGIKNATSRAGDFQLRGILDNQPGPWRKDSLKPGEKREFDFEIPDVLPGRQSLVLELADARNSDLILARKNVQIDVFYRPLSIDLIQPSYRNNIYATESLEELLFVVHSDLPEEEKNFLNLRAELLDTDGRSLCHRTLSGIPRATVDLQIPDLQIGEYHLQISLEDTSGEIVHQTIETIRKLPRVPHEWRIDAEGVLRHNGEPILPFGWFSIPPEEMADSTHAYNLMQWYSAQWLPVEGVREFLDRAVAAGTAVTFYPYPDSKMMTPASWGKPLTEDEAERIRQRVRALKDHPGLFAWYMADEPELKPALPERCRKIFEIVREEDPYHPCIMLNDTMGGIHKYRDGGDVLMPDPYPCFIQDGLAAQPIEKVGHFIHTAVAAGEGRKGVWITPQGFNYGDYGKKNQRGPNFTELRNQIYQAAIYGAKGFLWYTYAQTANYPDLGIGMPWLSHEVADLKEAILAPPAELDIRVETEHPEHLHISTRRVDDHLFLFAVNTAKVAQEVKLTLSGLDEKRLQVVSENRQVPVIGGVLSDHFDTYATHVYTTDSGWGDRPVIEEVIREIASADAARQKPGNLAFEENGTWVEFSSKSTYGSTPNRVLDGITGGMRWRDGTPGKTPDWLTVRFPNPATIGRIVVYSGTIASVEVQIPDRQGGWQTVGLTEDTDGDNLEVLLETTVKTDTLRVLIITLREGEEYSVIHEVEAYAD